MSETEYTFLMTDKAVKAAVAGLLKRKTPNAALRVGVKGGLCSGYGYNLEFCDTQPRDKDLIFKFDGIDVYIDKKSILYLNGTELDWEETLMKKGFKFNNPLHIRKCGCGLSFDLKS